MKSEVRALTNDTKIDPQSDQNLDQNGVEIFIDFLMVLIALGSDFGSILASTTPQEMDQKTTEF